MLSNILVDIAPEAELYDSGLVVVWQGVAGYYDFDKLKKKNRNENLLPEAHITKLRSTFSHAHHKDEGYLKLVAKNTSTIIKPKFKPTENKRQLMSFIKGEKIVEKEKEKTFDEEHIEKTSSFHYIPHFKQIISRVVQRIKSRSEYSFYELSESLDSSLNDYHNLSLINRNSSLVSSLSLDFSEKRAFVLTRENTVTRNLRKMLPDMRNTLPALQLMDMYVKEYHLEVPFTDEDLENKHMYDAVIKNNKVLQKLLKRNVNMLPPNLLTLLQNHKKMKSESLDRKVEAHSDKDIIFYSTLTKSFENILEEIAYDINEVGAFFYPLFKTTFEMVQPIDYLIEFDDEVLLKREIIQLNIELKANKNKPLSLVRWRVMEFIRSSDYNFILTTLLVQTCNTWLNNLLKCLFSEFSSVREESCIALAYLMTRQSITNELLNLRYYDISYDLIVTIFRAIDQFPASISAFYCLIGFIMQKSVNINILEFIADKGPLLTNSFMKSRWPKLIYYGLRYWPYNQLVEHPSILRKIKEILQLMVLKKSTKKTAKMTLFFLSRKFLMRSKICTVWFDVDLLTGKLMSIQSTKLAM